MKESSLWPERSLLSELETLRELARSSRREVWYPLIAFGIVDLGGAAAALLVGRAHLGPYMLPGTLFAGILSARHYRLDDARRGAHTSVWPWVAIILVAGLAGAACSATGREIDSRTLNLAGPCLTHLLGFIVLALWSRSTYLVGLISVFLVFGALAISVLDGDVAIAAQLAAWGASMLTAGLLRRPSQGAAR